MSTEPIQTSVRAAPCPDGSPASWVYLADLVLPPEKQRAVEDRCRRWRFRGVDRQTAEFQAKLSHFFSGQDVAYRITPRGPLLLMVGDRYSPAFRQFIESLHRSGERSQVVVWHVGKPEEGNDVVE